MKRHLNIIVSVLLLMVCLGLAIPAVQWFRTNPISQANRLKSTGKEEYLKREYVKAHEAYKLLVDSLENSEEAVVINYAHSGFLSSDILLNDFYKRKKDEPNVVADSALLQLSARSRDEYLKLTAAEDKQISSIASNQLGYSLLRGNEITEAGSDSLLFEALEHFKNALREDPKNDSARYNYELVKKVIDFPETVLAETKSLIARKRYKEAAALLQNGMRRDPRLRKQKDFMERLRTVISIDSLKTRGT